VKTQVHLELKCIRRINGVWMFNDADEAGMWAFAWLLRFKGIHLTLFNAAALWSVYSKAQREVIMAQYRKSAAPVNN
jgi:hypothetical protein